MFAVGLLVVVLGFIAFETYNAVVALRQRIDKAWANIDVALKQRHDQLPALVAAVRGLMAVRAGRADRRDPGPRRLLPDRADPRPGGRVARRRRRRSARCSRSSSATRTSSRRATSSTCRTRSSGSRAMIADRRELYNDQVFRYNTRIAQVPALLLAPLFGWRPREFFIATPEETARPDTELRPA